MTTRYDSDFYGWIQEQAGLLRSGDLSQLDTENLLEEIEAMGRSERRELRSRLEILLAHLLKWRYQADRRGRSWELTIEEQRDKAIDCLQESPSLKNKLNEHLEKAYIAARRLAEKETLINRNIFPETCPWTFEQIMDENFWPE
ncbi:MULTISPECIES: DUF29 domain-containing protein [Photorhabdus]|uniref:DUF29 domain-containing protein n=2 Tax=Photorhabdus TaxID=29487 RepID=A0A329X3U4_9GAMM|nr:MULTISPECIES: DUF29 domain-containing protein [Photorhabdus]KTL62939.1 hypothetical protein AA106_18805 [Photorhabdus laumondii subsp. laumondii]NDL00895.1 DUF29 family protein [Photorhabdus bodei]NDL05063.1 DUF29 family protein [Photorhabdus bodei]NDL09424.1 DUF29 family protein [Photorhabdus bodei]NHB59624.1 DUF29 domain-containing protein [Photorhabdus sp. RW14-46]